MMHDEAFTIECPEVAPGHRFTFGIPALIGALDSRYCSIRRVHALNHGASDRHKPATANWTEHLSSPLKVRKNILLTSIIGNISTLSKEFFSRGVLRRYSPIANNRWSRIPSARALFSVRLQLRGDGFKNPLLTKEGYGEVLVIYQIPNPTGD